MAKTAIEWTGTRLDDGTILPGYTFNGWIGCAKVSQGCKNCYAETLMDTRYGRVEWGVNGTRLKTSEAYWRQPILWNREAAVMGVRRKVFCASLADWLEDREDLIHWRGLLLELIQLTPNLDWLLLSKRPEGWEDRLHEVVRRCHTGGDEIASAWLDGDAPSNVWAGTSTEDQETADQRIPDLLQIPAPVHFLSCEPLLGPINFQHTRDIEGFEVTMDSLRGIIRMNGQAHLPAEAKIDWVIAGGESGPKARISHIEDFRYLRDQCKAAGVPFFFKQWGEFRVGHKEIDPHFGSGWKVVVGEGFEVAGDNHKVIHLDDGYAAVRMGKHNAGNRLDGVQHLEWPGDKIPA